MADINSGPGWSDAQWEMVNNAVSEAFAKASVAGAFLPRYGPLAASTEYVRKEKLEGEGALVTVADDTTLKLFNLTVNVELSSEQVSDDSLSSALLAFRRAANVLALAEDEIVFNGYKQADGANAPKRTETAKTRLDTAEEDYRQAREATAPEATIDAAKEARDRADTTHRVAPFVVSDHPESSKGLAEPDVEASIAGQPSGNAGEQIVNAVVEAIGNLEDNFHPSPFACVLGLKLFEEAHRPTPAMVLPADRITPMLNGPLLRSGRMLDNRGIVVSLAAGAIDIVVATPPKAQFLQVQPSAKYLFRVYERFVLRIKDDKYPAVQDFEI
jgi:uncharacterized linocin/CFP29 family protein